MLDIFNVEFGVTSEQVKPILVAGQRGDGVELCLGIGLPAALIQRQPGISHLITAVD